MGVSSGQASVLIVYKNFAANKNVSHIGLGVAAMNNQKVLRSLGLKVDVDSIASATELAANLHKDQRSHVVISAPWIPTTELQSLVSAHPETQFFVNCHSNVGFLQADTNGTRLFREAINLQIGTHNFHVAGNSLKFATWVESCFGTDCAYLPNCYYLDSHTPVAHIDTGGTLRVGVFGATRPLKNMMSAAAAALEVARNLRRPLELWVSSGRTEAGGPTVFGAIQNLLAGLPGVTLHTSGWSAWPDFRRLVGQMHLLLQPSYTESFNMVTADGVAMGVPSVTSDAVDWVPDYWQAPSDNVSAIAQVAIRVLQTRTAAMDGYAALVKHNSAGTRAWARELGITDLPSYPDTLQPHGSRRYSLHS